MKKTIFTLGALAIYIAARVAHVPIPLWLDLASVGAMVAYAALASALHSASASSSSPPAVATKPISEDLTPPNA